jgi:hypothetical protein
MTLFFCLMEKHALLQRWNFQKKTPFRTGLWHSKNYKSFWFITNEKGSAYIATAFCVIDSSGQTPVGSWSDHLVYNTANSVTVAADKVFASTGSSIVIYDKSVCRA